MNAEFQATLALAAHGNAALRARGCGCNLHPPGPSPLLGLGQFRADGHAGWPDATAWLEALRNNGARRIWVNIFQTQGGQNEWALEIELHKGAEVWLSRKEGTRVDFVRVISQLP